MFSELMCCDKTCRYYTENYKKKRFMSYSQADKMEGEIISHILYRNQSVCDIITSTTATNCNSFCHSVAVVLTLVQTKQIRINIHTRNNTKHSKYRGADKSLARPTSPCILFDASLVIYINSSNIPPIMIINRIYETQNLLSL